MIIVLELNEDEFGRGINRPVYKFEDETELRCYLLTCGKDISRLEIYRAQKLTASLEIKNASDY